jgi:lysophospholipase L1-like esterase
MLALGDSYTAGEAVTDEDRWTSRLAVLLRARGVEIARPEIIARTGWTTDELATAIDAAQGDGRLSGTFRLVTLLAGVNDQYRGRGVAEYRERFRPLLAGALTLSGGRARSVVVLSIPDWGVTPFAASRDRARVAREIDAFNAVNGDEASRAGVAYVDVTASSRRAEREPALIAPDGLHPSGVMYAEWATLVLPVALEALGA